MRHIVICDLSCYSKFFFLSHKRNGFRYKFTENKRSVLIFTTTSVCNVSHLRRNERDVIINVYRSSCKVPVILVRYYLNLNFLNLFSKNTHIRNLMKIRPVGAELFYANGRTDRHDEAHRRFPQFCEKRLIWRSVQPLAYHHHTACGMFGSMTRAGHINGPEVFFEGVVLDFVSHTVDTSVDKPPTVKSIHQNKHSSVSEDFATDCMHLSQQQSSLLV